MTQSFGSSLRRFQRWTGGAFLPVLVLSVAVLFARIPLKAQVVSGISGTVTDSSGATVASARVTVTNNATGVVTPVTTSSEGTFSVVGLLPGGYSVAVDAAQFKKERAEIIVEVAKMSTIDFKLVPGSTNETVEVHEAAIALETTSPVLGTTLEPELVKTAPSEISGLARQIDSFIFLAPGVQGTSNNHIIDGGETFENEVQFNGVPVAFVQYAGNQTYINPPYESVSEFRVNSSTYDARYGLGQGAVTYNMASGTNQFHGDGFEILRNQFFDSDGFFPTRFGANGNPEPPVNQENNYGFTLGGPIVLPKLYKGTNRTFFHFSDDWFRQNQAVQGIGTVPTVAMKNGDFSKFVDANGNVIPIYDPRTGMPFPGNIIPQSRISPLAKSVLPFIPNPNRAGTVFGLENNEFPAVNSIPIRQNLWAYTIDHNLSASQSIHFSQWRDTVDYPSFSSAPIVAPSNELQSQINNTEYGSGFLLNYVKTITPNLVVTAGADWIRNNILQENANQHVSFPGVVGGTTFPVVNFDGQNVPTDWGVLSGSYTAFGPGALTNLNSRNLGIVVVNNWLWSKGRHTFNFGGQVRRTYQDLIACQLCGGTFDFSQRTTSTPDSSNPNFGVDGSSFASFLLGEVDSVARINAQPLYFRNKEFASYAQDDFRATKRLTLNLGLRWDIMVPFTEDHNQVVFANYLNPVPDPGADNLPVAAQQFGDCAGCAGVTRAAIHWHNFQPRVGFAYMVNPQTVIRSGFYMTVLDGGAYEYGTASRGYAYSGLLQGQYTVNPTGSDIPAYGSWDAKPLPYPPPEPFSPSMANGAVIRTFDPALDGRAPYVEAWNFSVQRQLPWNTFLTVAYVGNNGVHLPATLQQPNQPNPSVLQYGSLLGQLVTSPAAVAAGIKIPYPEFVQQLGAAATVEQALSPYPQFAGLYPNDQLDGQSSYNAVQVTGEKRFSNGLSYLGNLTLSRAYGNNEWGSAPYSWNGDNAFNPKAEYTRADLDQKYYVKVVTTYELPIGYGKRYLNSRGVLGRALGGWQVSAILNYAGGYPIGPMNFFNPLLSNYQDRPNIVPGVQVKTFNYNLSKEYFEGKLATPPVQFTTNAFANTGPWQVGDAVRTYAALRTPPLRIENFAVMKYFQLTERLRATLRVDYFNAFNRTQLQEPDNISTDSTFGQITNLSSQISNRQGQATFRLEF